MFRAPLRVVNIGLESFAVDLQRRGVPVAHVQWTPPARGDMRLAALIGRLDALEAIETANREAVGRLLQADPVLIDVVTARDAIRGLQDHMILHAGPPIGWDRMCGPLRGAIAGAIVLEGWAPDLTAAENL